MSEPLAILLLASGLSRRFGSDKLMASLGGVPVLTRTLQALSGVPAIVRIAVVGAGQSARRALLESAGYALVENPAPETGQGRSLALSMASIVDGTTASQVLIALADMPCITPAHLQALCARMEDGASAVMSACDGTLMPPAIFRRAQFPELSALSGERGARAIFESLGDGAVVAADASILRDIDEPCDLAPAMEALNG